MSETTPSRRANTTTVAEDFSSGFSQPRQAQVEEVEAAEERRPMRPSAG
jgi:hypothetical protein